MGLKRGMTNNPAGRKPGSKNKVNADTRAWIAQLIDQHREQLEADILMLEPKDRWQLIEKLLQYSVPKLSAVNSVVKIEELTTEQLSQVANEMLTNLN